MNELDQTKIDHEQTKLLLDTIRPGLSTFVSATH